MNDSPMNSDTHSAETRPEISTPPPATKKKRANMHEGIGVWCDCCSCEAEPRWAELAEEMGVDLSDYEDETPEPPPR